MSGLCGAAWAQTGLQADADNRVEVAVKAVPGLAADSVGRGHSVGRGLVPPSIDLSLMPTRGRNGLGPMVSLSPSLPAADAAGAPGLAPGGTAADASVGLRWRYTLESNYRLDVTAWKSITPEPDAYALIQRRHPSYGARVEVPLSAVSNARTSGFVADRGFLGMQLDSGARLSVKRSGGRQMFYYRNKF